MVNKNHKYNTRIPSEMIKEYKPLDEVYDDWNDFFDKYADGKRQNDGIFTYFLGSSGEATLFWFEGDEFPFAYVHNRGIYEINGEYKTGYRFNLRNGE
jgi:hypothetical protein